MGSPAQVFLQPHDLLFCLKRTQMNATTPLPFKTHVLFTEYNNKKKTSCLLVSLVEIKNQTYLLGLKAN